MTMQSGRGQTPQAGQTSQTGARIVGASHKLPDGPGPSVMAADTLDAEDVVNTQGESLGKVKHIMLDVQRGTVAYAVLSFGGFLGMGDKLFAIPWHALQLDVENKRFILNIDKEALKKAPGFDKDHWPSMADMHWAEQVHTYYTVDPYWH